MLFAPPPSSADFYFRIGPVPVRVSWTHWLGAALIGWDTLYTLGREGGPKPIFLLLWLAIVFVSILVHELGHAFMARAFGYRSEVILVFFGGLAIYPRERSESYSREILITLAGPGAGFLLGAVTFFSLPLIAMAAQNLDGDLPVQATAFTLRNLLWVNIFWSILNLMPVLPLDGGRVTDVVCRAISPSSGAVVARWIGVVAGGLLAFFAFRELQSPFAGMFFLMFAYWNYQDVAQSRR